MEQSYLIEIQYLGYRFSGWMKQPNVKTIQEMFEKTVAFIYKDSCFKTFGTSRTDAKVSAMQMGVYLTIDKVLDLENFLPLFNKNLPNDIKALSITHIRKKFDPLSVTSSKHYVYLFAHNEKPHPFSASIIHTELKKLDIELMKTGAKLFEGEHNFKKYCTKPAPGTRFIRTIDQCEIKINNLYSANFFPKTTYALHVKSQGFLRYQVRLIMGQLLALGKGEITLNELKSTLTPVDDNTLRYIAPGSGLILQESKINY